MSLFLQIHALTPYAASLLNRDDVGRAKRLPYGGVSRIRVSSQCLKRHWREASGAWSLADLQEPASVRSRKIFSREIAPKLTGEFEEASVVAVLDELKAEFLGESKKAKAARSGKKGKSKEEDSVDLKLLDTEQIIVLGRPEIDYLTALARNLVGDLGNDPDKAEKLVEERLKKDKDLKANLRGMRLAAGLDAALFGRMVTSDLLARGDGAVHVAHSFTVHEEEAEPDYFTAVDDLTQEEGELGAALIQTSELTSGLFYSYVVIDVPLLVSNLEGCSFASWQSADRTLAAKVVERFVHLVATVSPGAKLGSTAPYGYADLVLVEAGGRQPRSLAAAFHNPVPRRGDMRQAAAHSLSAHLNRFDSMYGAGEDRRVASMLDLDGMAALSGTLDEVAAFAATKVGSGGV